MLRLSIITAAILALTAPSEAGVLLIDMGIRTKICEGTEVIEFQVWKHLGTTETTETITQTDFEDLVSAADYYDAGAAKCADFDTTAAAILSGWYTNLPTNGKTAFCYHFQVVKDAG